MSIWGKQELLYSDCGVVKCKRGRKVHEHDIFETADSMHQVACIFQMAVYRCKFCTNRKCHTTMSMIDSHINTQRNSWKQRAQVCNKILKKDRSHSFMLFANSLKYSLINLSSIALEIEYLISILIIDHANNRESQQNVQNFVEIENTTTISNNLQKLFIYHQLRNWKLICFFLMAHFNYNNYTKNNKLDLYNHVYKLITFNYCKNLSLVLWKTW